MATLLQSATFLSRKADGTPNALGKLYTYAAGTLTAQAAYTTAALTVQHTNPVILDAAGTATVWLDPAYSYRLIEKTSADVTIRDVDNVSDAAGGTGGRHVYAVETQTATAGQTAFTLTTMTYSPGTNAMMVTVDGLVVEDFTETSSTVVTLDAGLLAGQEVTFRGGRYVTSSSLDASEIGYTRDATGATARTQDGINAETISVKDFGAVGDGVTDDYAAIQAAITSATGTLTGYRIHFPAGIYSTSAAIVVGDKANMVLCGDGVNLTVIKPRTAVTTAVSFGTSGSSNQGIEDIHVQCEDATSCIGVAVTGIDGFRLNNVAVSNANVGIDVVNGFGQHYTNFRIDDSLTAGIKINGGNDQFFDGGVLLNAVGSQPSTAGIWIVKNEAVWLSNIDCIYQNTGLLFAPTGTDYISWGFVTACAFDLGTGCGVKFSPTASALVKGINFEGCWTSSNTQYGVCVDGAGTVNGIRFNGHRAYANTLSGYYLNNTGTVKNAAFVSCEASGNSAGSSGVYSGFDIAANISEFSIIGCRSGPMSGLGDTQARGVIVNAGTGDNYMILGNDLRGNTTGLVEGGSGTTKHVAHNLNATTAATGSSTVAVGASTRVITHGLIGTPTLQDVVITDGSGRAASGITDVWVSALGATTFQVNTNTNVTTTAWTFGWSARIKGA